MMKLKLYQHLFMEHSDLPPMPGPLVYVVAGNGVHLWARRDGLEALIPVAPGTIRELAPVEPFVRMEAPMLPAAVLSALFALARQARAEGGAPLESLFYPHYEPGQGWQLIVPPQAQSVARVRPLEEGMQDYTRTWWEIHSHHSMPAFFSGTDDADEQGFRLYGVVGRIFHRPEIRLRVGIYGHHWDIPARWVCMLPEGVVDAARRTDSSAAGEGEGCREREVSHGNA